MPYDRIVISSGHGLKVRGASGVLDEVDEARAVVDRVASELRKRNVEVEVFHDDISDDQSENLDRIVDFHNSKTRDLDVSVHFNAHHTTDDPMGTEVLYVTQEDLAAEVSDAICEAGGFKDRGAKYRDNLAFLNGTKMPSILIETCFVDSTADAELYTENFDEICRNIADILGGELDEEEIEPPSSDALFHVVGTVSHFGGPQDTGVSSSEGLAFHYELPEDNQHLFLPLQPEGTTGLARRLNPHIHYVACRWDYDVTPKKMLAESGEVALVRNVDTGDELVAFPADWGPNENTGRVADISPGLMYDLGLTTDDEVEVIYPYRDERV